MPEELKQKTSYQSKAMGVGLSEKLLGKAPIRWQILYGTIPDPLFLSHFSLLTIKNSENTVWLRIFRDGLKGCNAIHYPPGNPMS
jgi:hypothetical protein